MIRRWLPILCAAALATGCGSSSGSDDPATASATATGTPSVRSSGLHRLPQVPPPTGSPPSSLREVFDDAQGLWEREFREGGVEYHPARLTVFSQEVDTACGTQPAGVGPFYCPASHGVYLDPSFFAALSRRVGVQLGDFAQSYVIAHELGHHVQTLLGITKQKAIADKQDPDGANPRSVRFELQADCLAGVWIHSAYRRGDVSDAELSEALDAAIVVGDDFLGRHAKGPKRPPEEWTHGSSAQRLRWLKTGVREGRPEACATFSA